MTLIAPHIAAFLQQRLPVERRASVNTCDSYAHAFKLLFQYASGRLKVSPSQLNLEQIDTRFDRRVSGPSGSGPGNGPSSRNIRLAAIKSFMHFMEYRVPQRWSISGAFWRFRKESGFTSRQATSPLKRCNRSWMPLFRQFETASGIGRCCIYVSPRGLRVSEFVGLRPRIYTCSHSRAFWSMEKDEGNVACRCGRETTSAYAHGWQSGQRTVLRNCSSTPWHPMTRAGFEYILRKHACASGKALPVPCPPKESLRICPPHLCAYDSPGHPRSAQGFALARTRAMQTTEIYTRADPSVKLEALESVIPPKLRSGRFKATDH